MRDIVIAGYARSPFHLAGKGALARVRPDDLAAQVIRGLIDRTHVDPKDIEDIIVGCAFPEGEQGFNIARLIGLIADLPQSIGGMTVIRFCGSSMSAIHIAMGQIQIGAGEVFICAGVESMSRVPMSGFNPLPNPELAKHSQAYVGMGETAENVARKYQITHSPAPRVRARSSSRALATRRSSPAVTSRSSARYGPSRTPPMPPAGSPTRSCRSPPKRAWSTRMARCALRRAPRVSLA